MRNVTKATRARNAAAMARKTQRVHEGGAGCLVLIGSRVPPGLRSKARAGGILLPPALL